MFYVLLFIVLLLYSLHKAIHRTETAKVYNKIPGPSLLPVIGNAIDFLNSSVPLFYKGRSLANRYKTIARIWAVNTRILNIYDPVDIEIVLSSTKHITKGDVYSFLHPWLNDGLLTSTGSKWQTRRKILTPTFHFNILRNFCTIFGEQSNRLVERLKLEMGKETEILPFITDFTLAAICETAMGTNLTSSNAGVVAKYKEAIYSFGKVLVQRFTSAWLHPPRIYNITSLKKKQDGIIKVLHKFTTDVINERRKTKNTFVDDTSDVDENDIGSKRRLAMLDLLLTAEKRGEINDAGIREEVDTFMFEGHDTTTMAIMFALMLLANNPDVQDRIAAELDEVLGDSKELPTIEDLNKMRYLERCIKEALRLYPSVPFMNRQIMEDLQLKNFLVPAGTLVNIHSFDLHRKADLFPNPDKYDPDRFLPENCVNRHPFSYIPFSAGPRNCIGQKFAILEEKAVIGAIVRNFKMVAVTRPEDIIFSADLVLRCENMVKVKFLPRKQ